MKTKHSEVSAETKKSKVNPHAAKTSPDKVSADKNNINTKLVKKAQQEVPLQKQDATLDPKQDAKGMAIIEQDLKQFRHDIAEQVSIIEADALSRISKLIVGETIESPEQIAKTAPKSEIPTTQEDPTPDSKLDTITPKDDTTSAKDVTQNPKQDETQDPKLDVADPKEDIAPKSKQDSTPPDSKEEVAPSAPKAEIAPEDSKKDTNPKHGIKSEPIKLDIKPDIQQGLTSAQAADQLKKYGNNVIEEKHINPILKFLSYFWGPIPWMIEVAVILSGVLQRWTDFAIITTMLLINSGVGFWQEFKADNAIEALKKKLALGARVLRNGKWSDIAAGLLVPSDIVFITLGNIIPADIQLLQGEYLSVDQSALTGESLPVDKKVGDTVYSGSIVRLGEMTGVVTTTGMNTYFGKTAKLVDTASTVSHFQKAVLNIGKFLILITLVLVAIILVVSYFRHDPFLETLLFALILTIAAIPVALPTVLSVTMAVGALKLAKLKAIVSKLVAIEELAGMDILCSDKTGTLTQSTLTIGDPVLIESKNNDDLILAAALASKQKSKDVIDQAILNNLPKEISLDGYSIVKFIPFDSKQKRTEVTIKQGNQNFMVSKGAPQIILELVKNPALQKKVEDAVNELAKSGFRALGVARKDGNDWHYLGLIPLFDPLRKGSVKTVSAIIKMGIKIKMITGDDLAIAKEISDKLGLGTNILSARELFKKDKPDKAKIESADGFAEVFPEHKFNIVKALQAHKHIVGMTGDGVNDAPALKEADVGIAVSGATDAARAAADLVLTASGLSVIVNAIQEARMIFERMNSYVIFRIAETIRVLLFISLSILVFNFYPVTAVMIVLLALLNDIPMIMIAYDNVPIAAKLVKWKMPRILITSTALGISGVTAAFLLYFFLREYTHLSKEVIQTIIFLKLLVAGHSTIYITRNMGAIWHRPWPNWKLVVAIESTQVIGTLAAVYGVFITAIGWKYAIMVWCYSIIWFFIGSGVKLSLYKIFKVENEFQE